jgi:hypothetical protein
MLLSGGVIALIIRWTMSLVLIAIVPLVGIGCILFLFLIDIKNKKFVSFY